MEMDNGNSVDHYTKYNEGWSFAGDSSQRFRNKRRERSKRSFLSFQQMLLKKDHKSSSVLSDSNRSRYTSFNGTENAFSFIKCNLLFRSFTYKI